MVMTRGAHGGDPKVRTLEQQAVAAYIGAEDLFWGQQTDTRLPMDNTVITLIDDVIRQSAADLVMFNYSQDVHQDHRVLARCAISASRHQRRVLMFEVPSTLDFSPDLFMDIGDVMEEKNKLLRLHASQVDKTSVPHLMITESSMACATFRGFQGRVKYAEGFKALRFLMNDSFNI